MLNQISNVVIRTVNTARFKIGKYSPEILIVLGAASIIAGTVNACKSTMKLPEVLEKSDDMVEKIHAAKDGIVKIREGETYTEEDANNDLRICYIQTAWNVTKLYAPSVCLIGGGLACMLGSHIIMRSRNAAAIAAFNTVTATFAAYRGRVADRFGDSVQKEIERGVKAIDVETGETNEDGTPKTEKGLIKIDESEDGAYSVQFTKETAPTTWQNSAEYNRVFLKQAQNNANMRLKRDHFLFLNDVYRSIGIAPTKVGQIVGWTYNPDNPEECSFVDFGTYDAYDPSMPHAENTREWIDKHEKNIWLHFNVDDVIIDKI